MIRATIVVIKRDGQILLGMKKRGDIGRRTYNGPGGKNLDGETDIDCIIRETWEEVRVKLEETSLTKIAEITFFAAGIEDFLVTVFTTETLRDEPSETSEMVPEWFNIDQLPYPQMLESDRMWFGKAAKGEKFYAHVYYKKRAENFEKIVFLPFRG